MTNSKISRRKFLQTTISGAVVLPGFVSLAGANSIFTTLPGKNSFETLCLIETEFFPKELSIKLQGLGQNNQSISLDESTDWMETIKAIENRQNQALIILGRPATVFTMKTLLGPNWRLALEGSHHHELKSTRHKMSGMETAIGRIKPVMKYITDPVQYIATLASIMDHGFKVDNKQNQLSHQAATWSDYDLDSILALPGRGIA